MSNAKTHTLTVTSELLTSFLFRVMSCWKGRTFLFCGSQATVSQSSTKDLVEGLIQVCSFSRMSGYFLDKSSEFREKIDARPLKAFPSLTRFWLTAGNSSIASGAT